MSDRKNKKADQERVHSILRMATGSDNNTELMNELQVGMGSVSDNCITINDVANCDLTKSLNKLTQ